MIISEKQIKMRSLKGTHFFVLLISFVRGKSFFFQLCVGCHQFFRADGIEGDLIKKVCTHFADGKHRSRSECKVTHSVTRGKNISGMSLSDTGGYCGFFVSWSEIIILRVFHRTRCGTSPWEQVFLHLCPFRGSRL